MVLVFLELLVQVKALNKLSVDIIEARCRSKSKIKNLLLMEEAACCKVVNYNNLPANKLHPTLVLPMIGLNLIA